MSVTRVTAAVAAVAASTLVGVVATGGVASAAGNPFIPVTAKQCTSGGGKVYVSYPRPDKRVPHQTPISTCVGGKYDRKQVKG